MENQKSEDNTSFYLSISSIFCVFILIIVGGILFYIYYIKEDTTQSVIPVVNPNNSIKSVEEQIITENKQVANEEQQPLVLQNEPLTEEIAVYDEPVVYGDVEVEAPQEKMQELNNTSTELPFGLQEGDIISLKNPGHSKYFGLCNSCFTSPAKASGSLVGLINSTSDTADYTHFIIKRTYPRDFDTKVPGKVGLIPDGKVLLSNKWESFNKFNYLTICDSTICPLDTTKMNTWTYYEKYWPSTKGLSEFKLVKNGNDLNIMAANGLLLGRCDECIKNQAAGTLKSGQPDSIASAHISLDDRSKEFALWSFSLKNK